MSVQKVKFGNKPQRQQRIYNLLSKYVADNGKDYLEKKASTWNSYYVNGLVTINGATWCVDIRLSDHSQYGGQAEDYIVFDGDIEAEIYTAEAYQELIEKIQAL